MNKYFIIGIVAVLILAGGLAYRSWLLPESSTPVVSGKTIEVTVIAKRDEWRFEPEILEAKQGDRIILTAINEDDYDHGIAIDAFGVSQRMPANATIKTEFTVTQAGEFPFYCSVPCGEGEVAGDGHRTHFDMIGRLRVLSSQELSQ